MEEYKKKLDEFKNQIAKLKLKKKKLREKITEIQKAIEKLEDENVSFIYKNVKKERPILFHVTTEHNDF